MSSEISQNNCFLVIRSKYCYFCLNKNCTPLLIFLPTNVSIKLMYSKFSIMNKWKNDWNIFSFYMLAIENVSGVGQECQTFLLKLAWFCSQKSSERKRNKKFELKNLSFFFYKILNLLWLRKTPVKDFLKNLSSRGQKGQVLKTVKNSETFSFFRFQTKNKFSLLLETLCLLHTLNFIKMPCVSFETSNFDFISLVLVLI